MKKGPNNEASLCSSSKPRKFSGEGRRFTLPKSKILRGRTNFQKLFEPEAVSVRGGKINIRFRIYNLSESDCKMAFIVPKRLANAVQRNRVKRLLKEAYRHNQFILTDDVAEAGCVFHGALMAQTANIEYEAAISAVTDLLEKVKDFIRK